MPKTWEDLVAESGVIPETTSSSTTAVNSVPAISAPLPAFFQSFEERYQRMGPQGIPVPIDTRTGAPPLMRLKAAFATDPASKKRFIEQSFNGSQVDDIGNDQFIIRNVMDPETKTVKDLLFDENHVSWKDFLDFAKVVPETAGTILAIRAGKGATGKLGESKLGLLKEAALGSLGAAGAGVTTDAAFELATGGGIENFQNDLRTRAGEAAVGTVAGAVFGQAVRLGFAGRNYVLAPKTPLQESLPNSLQRLEDRSGIKLELSAAEKSGSPLLGRAEVIAGKTPFGYGPIKEITEATDAGIRKIQRWMMGDRPPPEDLSIGMRAVAMLDDFGKAAGDDAVLQRATISAQAAADLDAALNSAVGSAGRGVIKEDAGNSIRASMSSMWDAFKAKADELYKGLGADPVIPTGRLAQQLEEIKAALPKSTVYVEEAGKILDEFGNPFNPVLSTTTGERTAIPELMPEGLKKFITGIGKLDPEMPLSELRALRTTLNDAINQFEVMPGVRHRDLTGFSAAISDAIDTGVTKLNPDLAAKLTAANQFYRSNMERFEAQGIQQLLADPRATKVGPIALVNHTLADPDQYWRLKKMLSEPVVGPDGAVVAPAQMKAFDLLRAAQVAEMERRAGLSGSSPLMKIDRFLGEVEGLAKKDARMAEDILGGEQSKILTSLAEMKTLQGKVNADSLRTLIASGSTKISDFEDLVAAEVKRDDYFKNQVIGPFLAGESELKPKIGAQEFVDRAFDMNKPNPELGRLIGLLGSDPALLDDIRRKTIYKLFQDFASNPTPQEIVTATQRGENIVLPDMKRMFEGITGEVQKRNLETLLGVDTYKDLKALLHVTAARSEVKNAAASAVGGMKSGTLYNSLMMLQLNEVPTHAKYWGVSWALSSPKVRALAGTTADPTSTLSALFASVPFLRDATEDFGSAGSAHIANMFGRAAGILRKQDTGPRQSQESGDAKQIQRDLERSIQ